MEVDEAGVAAIHALLERLDQAWASGDAAAWAACFTADASFVTRLGTLYMGPEDIGRLHRVMFDTVFRGTEFRCRVVTARFYGPDTAVIVTKGDVCRGKQRPLKRVQTWTVVRDPIGRWLVAAVQDTQHHALTQAWRFRARPEIKPMVGPRK